MSEIGFVERLGDELGRVAIEGVRGAPHDRRRRWPRAMPRLRVRVLLGLALIAGGGAATAAVLSTSSVQSAAIQGISCIAPNGDGSFDVYGVSPTAACRGTYPRGTPLVACLDVEHGTAVAVVFARTESSECGRRGYRPLPRSYAVTVRRTDALVRAMVPLGTSRNCWTKTALIARVDRLLTQHGFAGWHADVPASAARIETTGPCAAIGWNGSGSVGDAVAGLLDPQQRAVHLRTGPSLAVRRRAYAIWQSFTGRPVCQSITRLRSELARAVGRDGLSRSIVATRAFDAGQFNFEPTDRRLYRHGCALLAGDGVAPDGATLQLWIVQRSAPSVRGTEQTARPDTNPYDGPPFALPPQRP